MYKGAAFLNVRSTSCALHPYAKLSHFSVQDIELLEMDLAGGGGGGGEVNNCVMTVNQWYIVHNYVHLLTRFLSTGRKSVVVAMFDMTSVVDATMTDTRRAMTGWGNDPNTLNWSPIIVAVNEHSFFILSCALGNWPLCAPSVSDNPSYSVSILCLHGPSRHTP
jgi:hypothetical protein